MRTTDSISNLAPPVARSNWRSALSTALRTGVSVGRSMLFRRGTNSLRHLSDRQLRDIGLTRDMLDPTAYDGCEQRERVDRVALSTQRTLFFLLLARGGL